MITATGKNVSWTGYGDLQFRRNGKISGAARLDNPERFSS